MNSFRDQYPINPMPYNFGRPPATNIKKVQWSMVPTTTNTHDLRSPRTHTNQHGRIRLLNVGKLWPFIRAPMGHSALSTTPLTAIGLMSEKQRATGVLIENAKHENGAVFSMILCFAWCMLTSFWPVLSGVASHAQGVPEPASSFLSSPRALPSSR